MLTTLFILLLTLAKLSDAISNDTAFNIEEHYESTIDSHEQLIDSWHQIYNDSAISPVVNYLDSLDLVNPNIKSKWGKARSHYIWGSICSWNLDYTQAMEHFVISLKALDDINDDKYDMQKYRLTGLVYKNMSNIFMNCEIFDKSLDLELECINEFLASNDSSHLAVEYLHLGSFYDMLAESGSDPDTNLHYIKKAENYLSKFPDQSFEKAYYDYCLSYYYNCINRRDTSVIFRARALRNIPKYNTLYYSMNRAAAYAFFIEKEYDSALYHAYLAYNSPYILDQRDAAEGLSEIYKVLGNESESVKYASIYQEIQRKYLDLKIQNASISKTYDTYIQDKTLSKLQKNNIQPIWIIIITVVVILIIIKLGTKRKKASNNKELSHTLFLERWNAFQETEIYDSIIERCDNNKDLMGDTIMYFKNPLTASEISTFKATIDSFFNNFTHRFSSQYPDLSDVELDYCYISILPLTEIQKAGLLSLSYQGIVSRRKRVTNKLKKSLSGQKLIDFMKKSLKESLA